MQTKTVDVHEAQTYLVELLSLVTAGTEIILTAGNTPLARIVPMTEAITPRVAGLHPGKRSRGKLIENQRVNFLGFAHRLC